MNQFHSDGETPLDGSRYVAAIEGDECDRSSGCQIQAKVMGLLGLALGLVFLRHTSHLHTLSSFKAIDGH